MHELEEGREEEDTEVLERQKPARGIAESILGEHATNELVSLGMSATLSEALIYPLINLKHHYDRVRPNYLDPTLIPSISVPRHPSYPSGHSTQTAVVAMILGCVDKNHREEYVGNDAGWRREQGGVHFTSDTKAGIGDGIF